MSYLSNEGRKDFHWVERAQTFKKLNEEFGMTQEEIGRKVGLHKDRVGNYIQVYNKTLMHACKTSITYQSLD